MLAHRLERLERYHRASTVDDLREPAGLLDKRGHHGERGEHDEADVSDGDPELLGRFAVAPPQRSYGFRFRYARCRITAAPSRAADRKRTVLTLRVQNNGSDSRTGTVTGDSVVSGSREARPAAMIASPGSVVDADRSSELLRPIEALARREAATRASKGSSDEGGEAVSGETADDRHSGAEGGGAAGAEHAVMAVMPLFLIRVPKCDCSRWLAHFRSSENQASLDRALGVSASVVVSMM